MRLSVWHTLQCPMLLSVHPPGSAQCGHAADEEGQEEGKKMGDLMKHAVLFVRFGYVLRHL